MDVEILDYVEDTRGMRLGFADIKVVYSAEKWEIFRGLGVFEKEGRKWLTFPNLKRKEQWLPYYERSPQVNKDILAQALKLLPDFMEIKPDKDPDDGLCF